MDINQLIELNRRFTKDIALFKTKLDNLEQQTKVKLDNISKELFPELEIKWLYNLNAGCMCPNWNPSISITSINNLVKVQTQKDIVWVQNNSSGQFYEHNLVYYSAPISKEDLTLLINKVKEETSLPCDIWIRECKQGVIEIHNLDDLLVIYPAASIIEQGRIYYQGWDIPDVYFIYNLHNKIHIAYSVNGHGFGCDTYVNPGDTVRLEKFYTYLSDNDITLSSQKETILVNWNNNND